MNSDEFEKELKAQPLRPVPPEWKAEILGRARPSAAPGSSGWTWLHELFWPSPVAWGTIAVIWLGIAGLNFSMREGEENEHAGPADYAQLREALEQKRELQADAEETLVQSKPEVLKPRSQTRPRSAS